MQETTSSRFDQFSDATECGGSGGVWFDGIIDPGSVQFDPNTDWVFASGVTGNNQFSCAMVAAVAKMLSRRSLNR